MRGSHYACFRFSADATVHGEASPRYTIRSLDAGVADRMHVVIPDASLIYLVRDPIDRIVSQYMHSVASGTETRPVDLAVEPRLENDYVSRGRYHWQLEPYLDRFDVRRILVVKQDDLRRNRDETLRRVFQFVGVAEDVPADRFAFEVHTSSGKVQGNSMTRAIESLAMTSHFGWVPRRVQQQLRRIILPALSRSIQPPILSIDLRRRLADLFRPDLERLHSLTGLSFDNWCVTDLNPEVPAPS